MATVQFREGNCMPGPVSPMPQLIPNIVDEMAATRPFATYMEMPRNPDTYADGYIKVDYASFANVINGLAWWLEGTLGKGQSSETLLYVGINDIRYNAFVLASIKAGYKTLLVSTTASPKYQAALMASMNCRTLFTSGEGVPAFMEPVVQLHPMRAFQVPSVKHLMATTFPYYPYQKLYEDSKNEPFVCIHTSGSTGPPKARVLTHAWAMSYIRWQQMEPPAGFESNDKLWQSNRVVVLVPPFHIGHVMATLMSAISNQTTVILPAPHRPRDANALLEILDHVSADVGFVGPAIVDELGKSPDLVNRLKERVRTIFWAGGSISEAAGNRLSKVVKLFNINGSSEAAGYPLIRPDGPWDPDLWQYIGIHPIAGAKFEHVTDDLHLLTLIKDERSLVVQPAFCLFPDSQRFDTKDMFSEHPHKPGFWRFRGRTDDIITLANAVKFNPEPAEWKLMEHPKVKGAMLSGTRRRSLVLLLEPADPVEEYVNPRTLIEDVWPLIEQANTTYLGPLSVKKEMILVTDPAKPMPRAGKGTVQRGPTLELYADEIDKLYVDEPTIDYEGIVR